MQTLFPVLVMNNKTYTSLYCDSVINQEITSDCAFASGLFLDIKSAILSSTKHSHISAHNFLNIQLIFNPQKVLKS